MKRRSIILYWLLLLVPTLLIGAAGIQLLRHEQERLNQVERSSALDRAEALAETLQITVEAVEYDIAEALRSIAHDGLIETLLEWEATNPLIRNVFTWKPGVGLQYPQPGNSATTEERRFVARYDALFSGRVAWRSPDMATAETSHAVASNQVALGRQTRSKKKESSLLQGIRQLRSGRRQLQRLAPKSGKDHAGRDKPGEGTSFQMGGWIPWFSDNKLHILGWVRRKKDGLIYGVELELVTLLSRLVVDFPAAAPKGMIYALVDDGGRILHQSGNAAVEPGGKPDLHVSLAPNLPHWQVAVHFMDGGSFGHAGAGFVLLSGLLLAIFIAAVILGGALLTRLARRNWLDAQQKSSFVSNVSHELKTPVTSIRMYAELLAEDRIKDPEKRKSYLQVIVAESRRLARLVNNVLDFGRLEQGRMKYQTEELDLTECVRDLIEAHQLPVKEAGLALECQLPQASIPVRTDRDALEQALLNLVDNATKYASDGGELTIRMEPGHDVCEIRIMDRGPGVPAEHRERIFEKFQRVDDSLTARRPGSGLGLTIARRILQDLGGDLTYETRDGGGSCFVVRIPLPNSQDSPAPKKGSRAG